MKESNLNFEPLKLFLEKPCEEPKWIWERQLAEGCCTLFAGKPKSGKSVLIRNLISAVSCEKPFMGLKTNRVPILYLAIEEKDYFLQKHFQKLNCDTGAIFIHIGSIFGNKEQRFEKLRNSILESKAGLVIIDPLFKFIQCSDTNDYSQTSETLMELVTLARETNAHVLAVHHENKGQSSGGDKILGSTAIWGGVDGAFFCKRNKDTGNISSDLRYGHNIEGNYFSFDENQVLVWHENFSEHKEELLEEEVTRALENSGSLSAEEISRETQHRPSDVNKVLKKMCSHQTLIKSGDGKKGNPAKYSLPPLNI